MEQSWYKAHLPLFSHFFLLIIFKRRYIVIITSSIVIINVTMRTSSQPISETALGERPHFFYDPFFGEALLIFLFNKVSA
jgi:hypothetical protein